MKTQTYVVEYDSNNSGGHWWLSDDDWLKLEADGWAVRWVKDDPNLPLVPSENRWLGALATSATIEVEAYSKSLAEGVAKEWWEASVMQDADDEGCNCCGNPHNFYARTKEGDGR